MSVFEVFWLIRAMRRQCPHQDLISKESVAGIHLDRIEST